ncbi:MAG: hypothetical protein IH584_07755 [Candidatus Aminicenantes bacterium]|nr:hypothetical protein [Candidatus Aminicenantes bacterium]
MNMNFKELINDLGQKIIAFMPNLLGGLLLLLLGWFIAWIAKRIIIQILVILRFDRLFIRFRWKSSLTKADIRYALYNLIGNIAFVIVFLIFLNSALAAMKLTILSSLIEQGVLFIPRLIVALVIFGIGWLIASRTANAVAHSLLNERVSGASLFAKLLKFIIVLFFSAMALVELNIAKEIVLIGFGALLLTLSVSMIIVIAASRESLKNFFNRDKKNQP